MNICEQPQLEPAALMDQWKKYGLNNPHLFIVKNTLGNDDCIRFLQQLTKEGLVTSKIRRSIKRSFFYQKLKKDCTEHELNRFFESPQLVCDIYNDFIGMFAIDISEFESDCTNVRLKALLDYVCENEEKIRFSFIVHTSTFEKEQALFTYLSKRLVIRRFEFDIINIENLMDYVENKNKENNITIDDQAAQYLELQFQEMLESKTVESINDMIRLYDNFVYEYRDDLSSVSKDQLHQSLKDSFTELETAKAKRDFGF
jgi:hypothetical protein